MKQVLLKYLGYFLGGIGAVIITPFVLTYYLIILFWKIFGTTILGFIIIKLLGGTTEECIEYGASMGFLIGIYLKYKELSK